MALHAVVSSTDLFDLACDLLSAADKQRVFVDNPARLYGSIKWLAPCHLREHWKEAPCIEVTTEF